MPKGRGMDIIDMVDSLIAMIMMPVIDRYRDYHRHRSFLDVFSYSMPSLCGVLEAFLSPTVVV